MTSGLSKKAIDDYLKLKIVSISTLNGDRRTRFKHTDVSQTCERTRLSFTSAYLFYKKIDALPGGFAKWQVELFDAIGDQLDEAGQPMKETVELWRRDPVECIRELIGNPLFSKDMRYAPERVYVDSEGRIRIYDEMWTANWWWDLQVNCPAPYGSVKL